MAKAAAKKVQPRVSGGGRRRSSVDSRQMELFSAPVSEPAMTPLPAPISAPELVSFAADLFEAANVDAQRAKPPTKIEEPPPPANDEIDSEAVVLLAISDLIRRLWREETGEDLYASPASPAFPWTAA